MSINEPFISLATTAVTFRDEIPDLKSVFSGPRKYFGNLFAGIGEDIEKAVPYTAFVISLIIVGLLMFGILIYLAL